MARAVDDAHPALADLLLERVLAELSASRTSCRNPKMTRDATADMATAVVFHSAPSTKAIVRTIGNRFAVRG